MPEGSLRVHFWYFGRLSKAQHGYVQSTRHKGYELNGLVAGCVQVYRCLVAGCAGLVAGCAGLSPGCGMCRSIGAPGGGQTPSYQSVGMDKQGQSKRSLFVRSKRGWRREMVRFVRCKWNGKREMQVGICKRGWGRERREGMRGARELIQKIKR